MKLKLICLLTFLLFLPSLFNFYSHDDFFNLHLAQVSSPGDFVRFFDPIHAPDRVGSYRPLTTQVYFLVSWLFGLSPLPLHLIAFAVFFADIFLVYKLSKMLLHHENSATVAAFLYAVSATHFAHLYWPALFQEPGLIFFFLLSVIFFIRNKFVFSLLALIGGLMSKETAIMIPAVLTVIVLLNKSWRRLWELIPHYLIVGVYLFIHLLFFGLPRGSVYTLDFSPKILNTFMWYILWAFNLPELFVDYIGPGLHFNPNLFNFYGKEVAIILGFFLLTILLFLYVLARKRKLDGKIILLCPAWFLITLVPVIFLPWHKFTYELGVPLVGLTIFIGWLSQKVSSKLVVFFCLAWFLTSASTLFLTYQTHWIILGARVAQRVEGYFKNYRGNKNIIFYDTPDDASLPWSPANELKIDLFDNDFFQVYYPGKYHVSYFPQLPKRPDPDTTYIPARQFLGY